MSIELCFVGKLYLLTYLLTVRLYNPLTAWTSLVRYLLLFESCIH